MVDLLLAVAEAVLLAPLVVQVLSVVVVLEAVVQVIWEALVVQDFLVEQEVLKLHHKVKQEIQVSAVAVAQEGLAALAALVALVFQAEAVVREVLLAVAEQVVQD